LRDNLYFDRELSWDDGLGNGEFANHYIGYGIHELYHHSQFSLSDIVRINYLWGEVKIVQQHFVEL
jgi:hypothetical protein